MDGSKQTVQARLVNAMPLMVTVTPNVTTSIVLTFRVAGSVTVVFVRGRITVTTEVINVPATSQLFAIGVAPLTAELVQAAPSAPSTLPGLNEDIFLASTWRTTGPWDVVSLTDACAPGETLGWNTPPHADPLLTEALGEVEICVEQAPGGGQWLAVHLSRTGPATTPTFAGLGDLTYTARLSFSLETPVFDGETLDLAALDGLHADTMVGLWTTVRTSSAVLYEAAFTGLGNGNVIPRE